MALAALPSLNSLLEAAAQQYTDSMGNIFNSEGWHVGSVPGSQADVGTNGFRVTPSLSPAPSSPAPLTASQTTSGAAKAASSSSSSPSSPSSPSLLDSAKKMFSWATWAGDIVSRQDNPDAGFTGISLEDLIFIVVGLILLAAAVGSFVFTFKETKSVGQTIIKTARGAADAKLAAALTV
jgi:hypothetical protein